MKNSNKLTINCKGLIAITLLLGFTAGSSFGSPGGGQVIPIQSNPHGKSYGEWGVAWWQWALSIPAATNPLLDNTGEFAGLGQSGSVWFLAGTFGNAVERSVTIPSGKTLLLPVHQWMFGAIAGDCEPSNPGVPCDVPTLRTAAAAAATAVETMEVTIDGRTVPQVFNYRAVSPDSFSVTLPANNVIEFLGLPVPAGTYEPQVSDGYWLMLTPLSVGTHTIRVHAVNSAFGVDYVVTWHITITAGKSDKS
jgi:hypothetical protein